MAGNLTYKYDNSKDDTVEHRYLHVYVPLTRQNNAKVPLGLRRSVSLEDISKDTLIKPLEKCKVYNSSNPSLISSVNSLCVRLKPHQLYEEYNEFIEILSNEHEFDWWNSIRQLRPLFEKIILHKQFTNEFIDDNNKQDQNFIQFKKSKRIGRRNAVCLAVDRLCHNQQLMLFFTVANEVQVEYNLMYSGFRM